MDVEIWYRVADKSKIRTNVCACACVCWVYELLHVLACEDG